MSADFELLMGHLRQRTGKVELDVPAPLGSAEDAVASRLARERQATIRRGGRVARLYKSIHGARRNAGDGAGQAPDLETSVTPKECRALIGAGAKWVGPKQYAPIARPYVGRLRIRNLRCIREIDFPLTPLHALIGPNDSGKSTLLEAIAAFSTRIDFDPEVEISIFPNTPNTSNSPKERALTRSSQSIVAHSAYASSEDIKNAVYHLNEETRLSLEEMVAPARILRLDPDAMRQPTNLIAHGSPLEYSSRGEGLAAVYDALLSRRLGVFMEISKQFTALFPTARSIQLTNPTTTTKALGVELTDGRSAGANQLSEGMLYWLAFAALPYLASTPLILIEEPENGLHPSRIGDVMGVLREVSNTSQVIIATHHPLVINELQPDEVTLITRTPERGTIATPLSKTKNFEQRSKVYALGELWLNYADGDFESDLVGESTLPAKSAS
jgi:predicted ATPase